MREFWRVAPGEHLGVRYAVLGSGSDGNCYVFESEHALWLVDAGFTTKVIIERLEQLHFNLYKPMTIFCTHTHKDHMLGVDELARYFDALVVCTSEVLRELKSAASLRSWVVSADAHYTHEWGSFSTFRTSHDAANSLSYQLELSTVRFMVLTDTGVILPGMYRLAYYSHVLFLEANYDEQLLASGKYPAFLKRRIGGQRGHLSNQQAALFVQKIRHSPHLRQLFLCHLSDENNRVELVSEALSQCEVPWQICVCPKRQMSQLYELDIYYNFSRKLAGRS